MFEIKVTLTADPQMIRALELITNKRSCVDSIAQETAAPAVSPAPTAVPPVPVAATLAANPPIANTPAFTYEQVGAAGAALAAANPGMMPTLTGLLQRYGVQSVADLKPDQLGPFAAELRALGARI